MLLVYFAKTDEFVKNVVKYLNLDSSKELIMYNSQVYFVFGTEKLLFLTEDEINNLTNTLNIDKKDLEILVISTHKSKHTEHLITLHYTGNYNIAELGGDNYKLNNAATNIFSILKDKIIKNNFLDPSFLIEATHHGPTSDIPVCFFEIGPNEIAYQCQNCLEKYCNILKEIIDNYDKIKNQTKLENKKIFILIGAEHYISKIDLEKILNKIKEKTNINIEQLKIGHIMPKYALHPLLLELNDNSEIKSKNKLKIMFNEMIIKSNADICVINKSYVKSSDMLKEILDEIKKETNKDFEIIKI